MNKKFNLYSRSEEEKSRDMIMYETKARAGELCRLFEDKKKKANMVTVVAAIILCVAGYPLFFNAYDKENILGMLLCSGGIVLLTLLARLSAGAILCRSLPKYFRWASLCTAWKAARSEMHDYEAKFADQTVFEPELKKAEKKLMDASDRLIAFAEKNGISAE